MDHERDPPAAAREHVERGAHAFDRRGRKGGEGAEELCCAGACGEYWDDAANKSDWFTRERVGGAGGR